MSIMERIMLALRKEGISCVINDEGRLVIYYPKSKAKLVNAILGQETKE